MIPLLTNLTALLGLTVIPALIGIYYFRNRFHRKTVSSHLLWEGLSHAKEGGSVFKKMQTPLVFILELLALLLLVIAALDPRWPASNRKLLLTVVLDDSASMLAVAGSTTPRDIGESAIATELRKGRFHSVRFILAGTMAEVIGSPVSSKNEIRANLNHWQCSAPAAALGPAITMAMELGGKDSRVLVITDSSPDIPPEEGKVQWIACGKQTDNIAFVNAARTRGYELDRCLVEIANYSSRPTQVSLRLKKGDNRSAKNELIQLGPKEIRKIVFNVDSDTPEVRAILGHDALAADNEVCLLAEPFRRIRIQNVITDEETGKLVDKAVAATGLKSTISVQPQIIFTDRPSEQSHLPGAWTVRVLKSKRGKSFVGPFVTDNAHPASKGLALAGTVWGASPDREMKGLPVVMAGNVPLITDLERNSGVHDLSIQLCSDLSTLQNTPDWPVLMWNILRWRENSLPGLRTANTRVGMHSIFTTRSYSSDVQITSPGGAVKRVKSSGGKVAIEAETAGIYSIAEKGNVFLLSSNFLSPSESDLSHRSRGRWGNWMNPEFIRGNYVSFAWILILLTLGILVAHQFVAGQGGGKA